MIPFLPFAVVPLGVPTLPPLSEPPPMLLTQALPDRGQASDLVIPSPQTSQSSPAAENGGDPLQVEADRQSYDTAKRLFRAEGNVKLTYRQTVLQADAIAVDLNARQVTATGKVTLDIGQQQQIRGSRLVYRLDRRTGTLYQAEGDLNLATLPTTVRRATLPTDVAATSVFEPPGQQPRLKFLRFQADEIQLTGANWRGLNVRVTNDRLGPPLGPELELEASNATLEERADGTNLLTTRGNRLWFDQTFSVPLLNNRTVLGADRARRRPPVTVLYDDADGGLIVRRDVEVLGRADASFTVGPKVRLQQFGNDDGVLAAFGLDLDFNLQGGGGQVTNLFLALNSLANPENDLRALGQHVIPVGKRGGNLAFRYAFRPRFAPEFGETSEEPEITHELESTYSSPTIPLGDSGIQLSYRSGLGWFDAEARERNEDSLQLGRARLEAALSREFPLWQPAPTALKQPRFSFSPIRQGLWLNTGLSGEYAAYTNSDTQGLLTGNAGFRFILGQFNRNAFDYTGVNVVYSNGVLAGNSPFNFDDIGTSERVQLGFLQQLYGPLRLGVETALDLGDGEELDTLYTLAYDRRTYGLTLSYSPTQGAGSFLIRIDDFNWQEFSGGDFPLGLLE